MAFGVPHVRPPSVERVWYIVKTPVDFLPSAKKRPSSWKKAREWPGDFLRGMTSPIATMPPKSPILLSSDQEAPSSSLMAMRIGYRPLNMITRFLPEASTTRWRVGVSLDVSQLLGV